MMNTKELKQAVLSYFEVSNTKEFKIDFGWALDTLKCKDLRTKAAWAALYREYIGIIPGDDTSVETGEGFYPWAWFSLDPRVSTKDDIVVAFNREFRNFNGRPEVQSRLVLGFRSLLAAA